MQLAGCQELLVAGTIRQQCKFVGLPCRIRIALQRCNRPLQEIDHLAQLIRIGAEHRDILYEAVYGASDNARSWWDNAAAFRLGYKPAGRAEEHLEAALAGQAKLPRDAVADLFQGGPFCSDEFAGDPENRGS